MPILQFNSCVKNTSSFFEIFTRSFSAKPLKNHGKDIVIVEGVRTPFVQSGTVYKNETQHSLAKYAISGLLNKVGIPKDAIDYVVIGNVVQDCKTTNVAREASLLAGLNESTPAHTVSMACISSNQAITSCIGYINSGTCETCIAGGVELLSDIPIRFSRHMRQLMLSYPKAKTLGSKLALMTRITPKSLIPELPAVAEFSTNETMGHSGDRLATAFDISREDQDRYALRSNTLADKAFKAGLLTDILTLPIGAKEPINADNGIRVSDLPTLGKLKPAFVRPYGTVTAGNASFLTDGASAALITTAKKAKELGLKPKAFLRDFLYVSQDPKDQLLLSPAYAIPRLLDRNGLTVADIEAFEIHEAFAGQVLANLRAMDSDYFNTHYIKRRAGKFGAIPMDKINVWGGSLSLGHPFAATGVRLLITAANRMLNNKNSPQNKTGLAVVAACAAGGQGHAMLIERYAQ